MELDRLTDLDGVGVNGITLLFGEIVDRSITYQADLKTIMTVASKCCARQQLIGYADVPYGWVLGVRI